MPTYEYRCGDCSHEFESFQSITAEPLSECPECGGVIERLISGGAALLFKGDGFYITDYRSESYKAGEKKDKEAAKSAEPKAKPETKAPSSAKSDD